jgi:rhomboid family GlyGly-CTERM serine protease
VRRDTFRKEVVAARRIPYASLLLALAAVLIYVVPGTARWFEYDRAMLAQGQAWRVVSCHWAHFTSQHLLWDVVVFFGLAAFCERRSRTALLAAIALAAVVIPAAVWCWQPELLTYRGLSGIDSAVFALLGVGILSDSLRERRWRGAAVVGLAAAGFIGKIIFEMLVGGTVFVESSAAFVPVPLAHLVGAACGAVIGLAALQVERTFARPAYRPAARRAGDPIGRMSGRIGTSGAAPSEGPRLGSL